jgi:hypothetical protein
MRMALDQGTRINAASIVHVHIAVFINMVLGGRYR